jgi:hypothetical protein
MGGSKNDVSVYKNADFSQANGPNAQSAESNGLVTDGKMWIGSTALNAGGTHINVGSLTSPNSSITFSYSTPNITAVVNPSVVTDYHVARYIVSAGGASNGANYTTIASAYAAAVGAGAPQTVFVQPGTYTENLTLTAGINIAAFECDALTPNVTITGKLTATFAGSVSLSGIRLKTNSDFCLGVTGSAATIVNLYGCFVEASNNVALQMTSSNGGAKIQLLNCKGQLDTTGISYFTHSGAGSIRIDGGIYENDGASTTAATLSGTGSFGIRNCYFACAITTSSTSNFTIDLAEYHGAFIHGSTGTSCIIINSLLEAGASSSLSISAGASVSVSHVIVQSSNVNAITGAGELKYAFISFIGSSSTVNTTTQTAIPTLI